MYIVDNLILNRYTINPSVSGYTRIYLLLCTVTHSHRNRSQTKTIFGPHGNCRNNNTYGWIMLSYTFPNLSFFTAALDHNCFFLTVIVIV
jgi:hypothetical protein